MLRLWPEALQIGLFEDHCWLRRASSGVVRHYPCGQGDGGQAMLQVLQRMLDDPDHRLRPGSKVVITVSDTLAALRMLPWQATLRRPDELRRYAEVLFGGDGRTIDGKWVMRAEFSRYGAPGLAFAFPRQWLSDVERIVMGATVQLVRVLPASVAAFELRQSRPRDGQHLFLLRERGRVSVLVTSRDGLSYLDVEPVTAASDDAMFRLIRRATIRCGKVSRLLHWSSMPEGQPLPDLPPLAELSESRIISLPREALC